MPNRFIPIVAHHESPFMSELSKLKTALAGVMTRDRGRLIGRWRRLDKAGQAAKQFAADMGFGAFRYQPSSRNFFNQRVWPIYVQGEPRGQLEMTSLKTQTKTKTHHTALEFLSKSFEPVQCQWALQNWIYVDFLGNVIPCCMTSGLMWRKDISGQLWQKIVGDNSSLNLYRHTFTDIIKSDFYQNRLRESLHSAEQIHHTCVGYCRPGSK